MAWINIKMRAPKPNERVLVYRPSMAGADIGPISIQWGWSCKATDATFWQPLPEMPNKNNTDLTIKNDYQKTKVDEQFAEIERLKAENARITSELDAAKTDISALLWLNGDCEYCRFGLQETYSGANRWTCKLGLGAECRAEWRSLQKEDGGNDE